MCGAPHRLRVRPGRYRLSFTHDADGSVTNAMISRPMNARAATPATMVMMTFLRLAPDPTAAAVMPTIAMTEDAVRIHQPGLISISGPR